MEIRIIDLAVKMYPHVHSDKTSDSIVKPNCYFLIEIKNIQIEFEQKENDLTLTHNQVSCVSIIKVSCKERINFEL